MWTGTGFLLARKIIEEVEKPGRLSQKLRWDMVNTFVTDRGKYERLREKAQEVTT